MLYVAMDKKTFAETHSKCCQPERKFCQLYLYSFDFHIGALTLYYLDAVHFQVVQRFEARSAIKKK